MSYEQVTNFAVCPRGHVKDLLKGMRMNELLLLEEASRTAAYPLGPKV